MPSPLHEYLRELLRSKPALAAELLCRAAALPLSAAALAGARTASQSFAQLQAPEYRADLVVEIGAPRPVLAFVVEVQLGIDADKQVAWPQYAAALWGRLRCPVYLLVVALDPAVAAWAAAPIDMGAMRLVPQVAGPEVIPELTDPKAARAAPELGVLSALAHAAGPRGLDICKGAVQAEMLQRLPTRYACIDLMLSRLPEAARRALEEWMSQSYEYQSELFRRLVAEGRAEGETRGRAEGETRGKAEGKAEAILSVLAARGLAVPEPLAARLRACRDLAELDRWLHRAVLVASSEELLA
ncbi:MAG: hypothetical protein HY744_26400 [Deltaproteobacteria bacterium]|nr:hypothetical protein [Deltaproteobacteria bacterium]